MGALRGCRVVKFDSHNNLWSSAHTIFVIILCSVSFKIKREYYIIMCNITDLSSISQWQGRTTTTRTGIDHLFSCSSSCLCWPWVRRHPGPLPLSSAADCRRGDRRDWERPPLSSSGNASKPLLSHLVGRWPARPDPHRSRPREPPDLTNCWASSAPSIRRIFFQSMRMIENSSIHSPTSKHCC